MKVKRKEFIAALNNIKPFCGRNQETADIFHHVLINADAGVLTASSGQAHATLAVAIEGGAADEQFCVKPRALAGILSTLEEETVEIRPAQETRNIYGERDIASIGIGAEFKTLVVRPASEWPMISTCEIEDELGSVAGTMLRKVHVPALPEDMRDIIQNAYFDPSGAIVATDIKRAHCVLVDGLNITEPLYIPKQILTAMQRHETVKISRTEDGDICLSSGSLYVWFSEDETPRPIDHTELFAESDHAISVDKDAMTKMLEKACQLHDGRQHLSMSIGEQIHAELENDEQGTVSQTLDFENLGEDFDEPITVRLNPRFLAGAIAHVGKKARLCIPEQNLPVTVFDPESTFRASLGQVAK